MVVVQTIYIAMFVLALFSALMVVLSSHAVHSALFLVLTMVSIAGMFVLMNAQLAGAFQIIVYAGAIMVLFLFVIMLLNIGRKESTTPRLRVVRRVGGVLALAFVVQMIALISAVAPITKAYSLESAKGIGIDQVAQLVMTRYIYAFEMTSVLLLVAVVGAVVLARKTLIQGAAKADDRF